MRVSGQVVPDLLPRLACGVAGVLLALAAARSARAASDDAWDALFEAAAAACISASGFAGAQAIGAPTDFSDRVLVQCADVGCSRT